MMTDTESLDQLAFIRQHKDDEKVLRELFPTVRCSFKPNKYERIWITQLRNKKSSTNAFRIAASKLGKVLVQKVVECLPTTRIQVETPEGICEGERLASTLELVSIMRSGDALLDIFMSQFPNANVSKILIQRDEETALPIFKYMKLSSTIKQNHPLVITEPMLATGGTLGMAIPLLKEQGVKEENILIACLCAAPEGLLHLSQQFPKIGIVFSFLDEKLNEKKFIVPGIGDFGDRYFGTPSLN